MLWQLNEQRDEQTDTRLPFYFSPKPNQLVWAPHDLHISFSLIWHHHITFLLSNYFNLGFPQAILSNPEKSQKTLRLNRYSWLYNFNYKHGVLFIVLDIKFQNPKLYGLQISEIWAAFKILFICDTTNLLQSLNYNRNLYLLFEELKFATTFFEKIAKQQKFSNK